MLISAHDQNSAFYNGVNTPWAHAWTSQNLVTASRVTATGGTYEVEAPKAEENPRKLKLKTK